MRVITLDLNKKVTGTKIVNDSYIDNPGFQTGEIISDTGEYGQIQQPDGSFINDPTPIINIETITDNTIVIKKTVETTQPSEVTVSDQTDHWNIKVVRNITSQVVDTVTYYTYEYIEASAPKDSRTQQEIQAIALSRKNDFFTRAEYPIATIYDDTKSSSDLMKIIFAIMDKNDALTQRVSTLEGGH